ncbi:MAG: hypothetical protein V3T58_00960 [Candidatus Hydrothermarchaeales archaeon]
MKPFIIGVGRAGCRIADLFLTSKEPYTGILMDSEDSDVKYFDYRYKLLLGDNVMDGNGTGGELEIGREIMEAEKYRIVDRMDSIKDEMDCILVISAMGGGTGGAVDVLAEELKRSFTEPVYCMGVLPSEEDPERAAINFSECFRNIVAKFDAVFPIDNDRLRGGRRLRPWYNHINKQLFWYFRKLFDIGEYKSKEELGENVVTATDVTNTLNGICSIGIGSYVLREERSGLFSKHLETVSKPELVVSLTEKAAADMLFPFEVGEAQKALVVVSGPRSIDFMGSIPARLWVEKNIGGVEVRGGDIPSPDKKDLEVMVALSGVKRSERIRYFYQLGKMLKSRGTYSEKLSRIFDRLKALDGKLYSVEEDFRLIYDDVKGLVNEPMEEKKKEEARSKDKVGEDLYPEPAKFEGG